VQFGDAARKASREIMDSRDRVLATLNHEEPDRCATYLWITPEALCNLMQHVGVESEDELERALEIDRWRAVGLGCKRPEDYDERVSAFIPEQFRNMPGCHIQPDGVVVRRHEGVSLTKLKDVAHYPLQDVEDADEAAAYPFSSPDWLEDVTENLIGSVDALKREDAVVTCTVAHPFKTASRSRGMERFLCDFLVNKELAHAVYDRLYAFITAQSVALTSAGVDVVMMMGDIAMHDRLMMSPATWREFEKPRLAVLIEAVKDANPDVKVFMHSDGDLSEILPDLVGIGLDILNPIQPECMDPFEIKKTWGDRIVLHGAVSLQRTLPFGSVEDVRAEIRQLVDHCGRGGGFVLGPSNVIMPEFPVENAVALYEAVG
jgi:uroporphyrinogen decarboxylase